jgi:signal peptidase II
MTTDRVPLRNAVLFAAIALVGVAFDLSTKAYFFRVVGPPGSPPRTVIPDMLELQTNYNTGALWGFGSLIPWSSSFFAILSMIACVAILYWLFVRKAAVDAWLTVSLGLITAGAIGNCYDRLVLGRVRDFVYLHIDAIHFKCAIFNFADNMLVLGAILLMLLALRPEPSPAPASEPAAVVDAS